MKLLGLHGNQQNGNVFDSRCSKFISKAQKLKLVDSFLCLDGPHLLPLKEGDQERMRAWYNRDQRGRIDEQSLEASLAEIQSIWETDGPFDGVIGFSMGGTMAAIVASLPERFARLRFVVIAGAPDVDEKSVGKSLTIPKSIASLHFIGQHDQAVPPSSSHALAARFHNSTIVEHDMGHCIPTKAAHTEAFTKFLLTCAGPAMKHTSSAVSTVGGNGFATQQCCATDEIAALQSEEVEVLSAMFPEEFTLVPQECSTWPCVNQSQITAAPQHPPAAQGNPCASYHVALSLDPDQFLPEAAAELPPRWRSNLGLLFHLPARYPLNEPPHVTVTTGQLTLHDQFSDARLASLEAAVAAACTSDSGAFLGEACAMLCIQAANEWFYSGQWRTSVLNRARSVCTSAAALVAAEEDASDEEEGAGEGPGSLEEADAAAEAEMIRAATEEAFRVAHEMKERWGHAGLEKKRTAPSGGRDKEAPAPLLPPSARGVWPYTVGLVGKPSAGKSTFYNAVTRAALERGGRLMAAVAPHPFTTIEPNIGPGWYASTEAEGEVADEATRAGSGTVRDPAQYRRTPLHGRAGGGGGTLAGRRLLPVVVKDVAGLVPGAYKGRGKGNRFLADLCDADVLVHVVDVTGKADKDGNAVTSGAAEGGEADAERGSTPMEDAAWIREELHRWIYGNVRGKWSSVTVCTQGRVARSGALSVQQQRTRCAQRVLALFTGYQGPRWCVERAADRAGLDLEQAAGWSTQDLHRMVGHFLSIRFPVCLALNKIDALGRSDEEQAVVEQCRVAAALQGEAAVPVSARAECFLLNTKAGSAIADSALEEGIHTDVMARFGTTGVLEAISAAVALKPPVLSYPVGDLDSECPVGWTAGRAAGTGTGTVAGAAMPRLQDCLQMKPGSTVGDVFEALKRGVLGSGAAVVQGEFVRADGRGLGSGGGVVQLRKDSLLEASNCVLRIQTNRKAVWQQTGGAGHTVIDAK